MCTSAPVVGVNTSMSDSTIAVKLMHIDRVMLALMVFTVALESRFKYGIFEISSLIPLFLQEAVFLTCHRQEKGERFYPLPKKL